LKDRLGDQEKEGALVLAEADDQGGRIDKLDRLTSKGIQARIERSDLHRLIVALITVTYDVLSLGYPASKRPLHKAG